MNIQQITITKFVPKNKGECTLAGAYELFPSYAKAEAFIRGEMR